MQYETLTEQIYRLLELDKGRIESSLYWWEKMDLLSAVLSA